MTVRDDSSTNTPADQTPATASENAAATPAATSATATGSARQNSPLNLPEETMEFLRGRLFAANFGNIISILMQSPHHRDLTLADLYDHVVPPLLGKQFRIAEGRKGKTGTTIPAGLVLWARVSDDVHQRLLATETTPLRLKAKEWRGGDHHWIIDLIGEQRFVLPLIQNISQTELKGVEVNYKRRTETGLENRTFSSPAAGEADSPAKDATPESDKASQESPAPAPENSPSSLH